MIRAAGVRRAEERDDHMVHAIGLGLTRIDAEMRETMAKNEALAEALAMAEEANVAKTAFLSNMSHEIRTPMNAILGLNKLALHDESLTEQTRGYLEKTGDSARHLLALINDILDMSRIESGRIVLRREEFSFSGMLEQINTMVMSQCEDKGLHYECSLLSPVNDYYIGDDMKLKEVLINILSNAIKFTGPGGSVRLTVERTAEYEDQSTLCFRIRDTGIGMDKSYIPKIFDAFSQEDSTRKNKYGSTGLGMAITKSIVEMMNGTISVESEKGAGTEFTVVIPLRNSLRTGPAEENAIDPGSLRVLIVDDEEIVAEHGRLVLDEAGIRADVCHSGAEALNMLELQSLKQEPYNLVLMDWRMPEMDGVETTRQIRQKYGSEDLAIIMTAYTWDTIREEALAAGVDGFLAKPLFASSVVEEFEHIVRRNQADMFKEKHLASLEGRRILMAEDMEVNAEIMMDILSLQDAEADHAENGKIAVEMFEKSEPGTYAAILMDIRMPVMDGLEAAATIRALNRPDAKRIPIIALTANAFDEDVQRSLQAGMNAHLTKPVDADHLFQTLEELIYEAEHGSQ
jgi:signal transduction histidine kinase/CheY-like chemotaxis protein